MARPTYARIDLDAIMHNCREMKKFVGNRAICAAVKADAYGHGAPAAARAMSAAGVDMFAVAMTEEGVELREAGIQKPIVLLTAIPPADIETVLRHRISVCVCDESFARDLSREASRLGLPAHVHANIDTGMGRVGLDPATAADSVLRINRLPAVEITGIFTHFACSEDPHVSHDQLSLFMGIVDDLRASGFEPPLLHVANSTATLTMPRTHLDCVRPGLVLYGLEPPAVRHTPFELKPALSLHTEVSFCKQVAASTPLSYGHTYTTDRDSMIATLPVGYHDGYLRQYSNTGEVLVHGHRAPIVGRVCMDQCLIDVTDIPDTRAGDPVVVYGSQGDSSIRIEEMADEVDRVPYELTCSVGGRVRRRYMINGQTVGETPMRSLVPPDVLNQIFQACDTDETPDRKTSRLGAA
ncbi:MAG: alanine racemase [Candidatus Brocadiia bacterium]